MAALHSDHRDRFHHITVLSSVLCYLCSNHTLGPESSAFHALGGVPNIREVPNRLSAYDFVGCIGHVVVNGYLLDVAMPTKSHAMESSCDKWMSPTVSVLPLLTSSCIVCNNVDVGVCNYVLGRLPQTCSQGERARSQPARVHLVDKNSW